MRGLPEKDTELDLKDGDKPDERHAFGFACHRCDKLYFADGSIAPLTTNPPAEGLRLTFCGVYAGQSNRFIRLKEVECAICRDAAMMAAVSHAFSRHFKDLKEI